MPYRRRFKRRFKRKRAARTIQGAWRKKRATKMKFGSTKSLNYRGVHFFKDKTEDTVRLTPLLGTNTTTGFFSFSISTLSNLSNFVNLFDSYQIKGVKVKFYPVSKVPGPAIAAGGAGGIPSQGSLQLVLKPDYNDNTVWNTYQQSLQTDPKVYAFGDHPRSLYMHPRPRIGVVEDPGQPIANSNWVTAQTKRNGQMWLSTAENLTQHWGLKFAVHNVPNVPAGGTPAQMYVVTTYYLAFKDQK